MEDLEARLLEEIDICDSNNHLAVVKYVNDIYSFYRETEVDILQYKSLIIYIIPYFQKLDSKKKKKTNKLDSKLSGPWMCPS